ncbi:MAG TPA: polysaccharide deacetylase family protein [Bacteroidia bacterium]|nr:polysaccharide deacetylase family protein [Bacteroidia bacterium]
MSTITIYTHRITGRNRYIFRLYFRDLLGMEVRITDNAEEFLAAEGVKLSYTTQPLKDELFFLSRNLLFETGISEQNITVFDWEGNKAFFSSGKTSALPFDLFAAGFYLVSRYEEYLPHIRDRLDRFDAHQSLAWLHGFLHVPVVNRWAILLKEKILERFPGTVFREEGYRFIPSIDIDNAWAYLEKGVMRTAGGYARSVFRMDFEDFRRRTQVLLHTRKDPYDTYEYQLSLMKKTGVRPMYFFLVGDYGVNDKNVSTQRRKFRELIRHLADYSEIGVHPSFASNTLPGKLQVEIQRLKNIVHREITNSRQHFLMLRFPNTYRNLIERDITDDFSMGFANEPGFRAGICTPFFFYDLDLESETVLRVHPFTVMDATLNLYLKLTPEEAIAKIKLLNEEVRKVNGTFMSLWHNETLSDEKEWKGWRIVYEELLKIAT